MLKEMARFYLSLITRMSWKPVWMELQTPELKHFHRRRFTEQYRRRQKLVERVWVFSALVLFFFPSVPLAVGGMLFSTFVSFCILDESD